jgi:hypothetical protein
VARGYEQYVKYLGEEDYTFVGSSGKRLERGTAAEEKRLASDKAEIKKNSTR